MSGERSIHGVVIETDRLQMTADRPVSALQTLRVRNNMQHLVDVACQTRLNWVASTSSSEYGAGGEAVVQTQLGWMFPVTLTSESTLPSFDIRIAARFTGAPTGASITTALNAYSPHGTPNTDNVAVFTDDLSVSTATWYDHECALDRPWRHWRTTVSYSEDIGSVNVATTTPSNFVLLKLEISTYVDDAGAGNIHIVGAHVREYLV